MISLRHITAGNPFADHPTLRTIFPGDRSAYVERDTIADLSGKFDRVENHVYLVVAGNDVVGITGFFVPQADFGRSYLGLRWHGVVPDQRGKGYSKEAFEQVVELAKQKFPMARSILEFVPCAEDERADRLIAYFGALGFELMGGREKAATFGEGVGLPEGSGLWQAMRYRLKVPERYGFYLKGQI